MKTFLKLIVTAILLSSCEDKIKIDLPQGETLLVVDGWITNEGKPNIITLSTTAPYFANEATPRVQGATVIIADSDGTIDTLTEVAAGQYQTHTINGKIGNTYTLQIFNALGENYIATAHMDRGSVIDSITYEYSPKDKDREAGYYAKYNGPEPQGVGDFYRFLVSINGQQLNQPGDLFYFSSDELVDGKYIQEWEFYEKPLQKGDVIMASTLSLSQDAYYFFNELATQANNGGMFANPSANVRTNIVNTNPKSTKKAVGYFGANAVSSKEIQIE